VTSAAPVEAGDDEVAPEAGVAPEGETFWQRRKRKKAEKARKPHRKAPWWELPALVALAIVIAILVKTFVIQPFYIPSDSMEHTLHGCPGCSGDRILVNKPIYDPPRTRRATPSPAGFVASGSSSASSRPTARCWSSGSSPPAGRPSRASTASSRSATTG
jgi:hypothetical protein